MGSEPDSLKAVASAIATRFEVNEDVEWERVRDVVDFHTGGDLHPTRLDILTDMVVKRIKDQSQ